MTNFISQKQQPGFPWIPFLFCFSGLCVGVGFLATRDTDFPVSTSYAVNDSSEITAGQAARIRRVTEAKIPRLPFAVATTGKVSDISKNRIIIHSEGKQATWPLSDDLQIWKDRTPVQPTDVKAGDLVQVDVQQKGSDSDGWMNMAVRINVLQHANPDTTDSDALAMPTTTIDGSVVKTGSGVITIADDLGRQSTLPLKTTALVMNGVEIIPLAQLATNDKVRLTTSKVGSRADGWVSMVDQIQLRPIN